MFFKNWKTLMMNVICMVFKWLKSKILSWPNVMVSKLSRLSSISATEILSSMTVSCHIYGAGNIHLPVTYTELTQS